MAEQQEPTIPTAETKTEPETAKAAAPISLDALLSAAGRWATVTGVLIGLAYVAGYIIVNLYLALLGIRPLNLVASRYLATGLVYLLITMMPLITIGVGFWTPSEPPEHWAKWRIRLTHWVRAALFIVCAVGLLAMMASLLTRADPSNKINGKEPWEYWLTLIGFVGSALFWSIILGFAWSLFRTAKKKVDWWSWDWLYRLAYVIFFGPVVFGISCILFAGLAYPHISPGYGGGASTPVRLMIDPSSDLTTVLPMSSHAGTTDTVALIDQNDDGYIIWLTTTQQIAVVPHDAVRGVIIRPAITKPSPLLLP